MLWPRPDSLAEAFIAISRRRTICTHNRLRASFTKIARIQRPAGPRARADKIVQDYLSEAEQDSAADTFPMIGLPNDISRTDRAVRQAFEAALKLMIQSFEQAANGNAEAGAKMHSPSPRLCRRHGSVALDR